MEHSVRYAPLAAIQALLAGCRPSAITRFVVAVVVYAVKAIAARHRSHVCKEGRETDAPSLAYGNAASTPVLKVGRVWIQAARFHAAPCQILRRFVVFRSMSVYQSSVADAFTPKATTALGGAVLVKVARWYDCVRAAIAAAEPMHALIRPSRASHRDESPEAPTGQIFQAHDSQFYHVRAF